MGGTIQYLAELKKALAETGILPEECGIVGSSILAWLGLKKNRDIDIIVTSEVRERLSLPAQASKIGEKVEVVGKGWAARLGLPDDELIGNPKYHVLMDGYRIVRPEILLAIYQYRSRSKDLWNRKELADAVGTVIKDWRWDLLRECLNARPPQASPPMRRRLMGKLRHTKSMIYDAIEKAVAILPARVRKFLAKILVSANRSAKHALVGAMLENPDFLSQTQLLIPSGSLLSLQYDGTKFLHYDVLLRYLVIASIVDGSDAMEPVYREMQEKRTGECHYDRFKNLVKSVEEYGLLDKYAIPVFDNGQIANGAHRFACALYFNIKEIPIHVINGSRRVDYGRDWFVRNQFSQSLIQQIDDLLEVLMEREGVWFPVILWPSVRSSFDEITSWIKARYIVRREREVDWGDRFSEAVRRIYQTDDIEPWKVELKLHCMKPFGSCVRILCVELPSPDYHPKAIEGKYMSRAGAEIKGAIRAAYKNRIKDYFYDIICHTGDNSVQNREIFSIIREMEPLASFSQVTKKI